MNVRNIIKKILFYVIILIAFFAFFNIKNTVAEAEKESWAVDEACMEVKSRLYAASGEIPNVSGKVLYENGQDCIVIVSFDFPELNWENSKACHVVYGHRKETCYTSHILDAPSSDYEFDVEELKVLWKIE